MKFGKNGNLCLYAIVCDKNMFSDWKNGKVVYLVQDDLFTAAGMTEDRNKFTEDYYKERRLLSQWQELTEEEKWDIFCTCFIKGKVVTYAEFCTHLRIEEEVGDYVIFNALDGFLDPDDDSLYIERGGNYVNITKAVRLLDPKHKYTQVELMQIYHAVYPYIKRDETSSETENKEAEN